MPASQFSISPSTIANCSTNGSSAGQSFAVHTLDNGLTVIAEEMAHVSSAAFAILLPMGAASDPEGEEGSAVLLSDLYNKGAGEWDSRALSEECEKIGLQRNHTSGIEISIYSGALLGENIEHALEIYSTILSKPKFPEAELESVKQLALQDLSALEDQPSSKAMSELAKAYYPAPFGRSQLGTKEGIEAASIASLKKYLAEKFTANQVVLSLAGAVKLEKMLPCIERCFGSWSGSSDRMEVPASAGRSQSIHVERDTAQVQIALAYPSVTIDHPDYYTARVIAGLLSGGMSGRLFIEVREKRGLVYRVSASHSAARGRAAMFASAGTTPENAEETLSVILTELERVKEGASDEELNRAKADLKSRLIMQSEISSSRTSSLINDHWNLGRLRTIDEIKSGIDRVTSADISRHCEEFPVRPLTLVSLGPKALEVPQ